MSKVGATVKDVPAQEFVVALAQHFKKASKPLSTHWPAAAAATRPASSLTCCALSCCVVALRLRSCQCLAGTTW